MRERDKSKPFFLYLPFLAPHEPLKAPQELIDKYAGLKDERDPARSPSDEISKVAKMTGRESRRPLYAAVVDAMDQAVGRVLTTLDEENIADNTIVMFFSDNGATRVHGRGGGDNAPYRGGKGEVYEGGIRVVSVMRWPALICCQHLPTVHRPDAESRFSSLLKYRSITPLASPPSMVAGS
ncbi:sulfatase-like hydrolase/transferase [Endozoicomonas lisbonensis]|uniref:sulfatase-like hydrolase/transferase n=1 Tax=Endozoicomonas lisbonensis TaxID=3120522 RepID=UPI0033945C26